MSLERDIQFIYEMGCIRFIQRVWRQMLGPNFADLAEHMYRMAWIALVLAKMEGATDTGKIVKMVLAHDITESRTGDVHYMSRLYTTRDEHQAIKDILKDTSLEAEFLKLWDEYEKRESIESKIVKDADTLDVDFELHEQAAQGVQLENQWHEIRTKSVYPKLYTASAKKIWEQIASSNVHDWHVLGPNRHNAGDWKLQE